MDGQARIACTTSLSSPPITDDRSPSRLGALFGGMSGAKGGVAVRPDGSNINPVSVALLKFKLPDGGFLIPTPETVDSSKPFASQGFSSLGQPCRFDEDQLSGNSDWIIPRRTESADDFSSLMTTRPLRSRVIASIRPQTFADLLRERSTLTFRAEFYDALNHPQFANPDSNFSSSTFGIISSTAVNPRVVQVALRFAF
jgi:hypothetical protein